MKTQARKGNDVKTKKTAPTKTAKNKAITPKEVKAKKAAPTVVTVPATDLIADVLKKAKAKLAPAAPVPPTPPAPVAVPAPTKKGKLHTMPKKEAAKPGEATPEQVAAIKTAVEAAAAAAAPAKKEPADRSAAAKRAWITIRANRAAAAAKAS